MKKVHALAVLASMSACAQQASAVDMKAGDWTVNVGGIVNAYYTGVSCNGDAVGGLALGLMMSRGAANTSASEAPAE